ncbi:MAG: hypothetical protein ACPGVB_04470 [Chitinophagales bacterium]
MRTFLNTFFNLICILLIGNSLNAQIMLEREQPLQMEETLDVLEGNPTLENMEGLPDLRITSFTLFQQSGINAGDLLPEIEIIVENAGHGIAIGTDESPDDGGYMIDFVLSDDNQKTLDYAYPPTPYVFHEDMLLRGGRISNTVTLQPGQTHTYKINELEMPQEINCEQGWVNVIAVANSGRRIAESDFNNNLNSMGSGLVDFDCQEGLPDLVVSNIIVHQQNGINNGSLLPLIEITIDNIGTGTALGTDQSVPEGGYMIDIILSDDHQVPLNYANVPEPYEFREDMLLLGGRLSNTITLQPGQSHTYSIEGLQMPDLLNCKQGWTNIIAFVNAGQRITESNFNNNTNAQAGSGMIDFDCH